jgi:asparagine synthase (glutamine-hydrolysing)
MCGISGFNWEDKKLINAMKNSISYRGPDDNGIFTDKNISLGHNRLSIIDLSKDGHQPMSDDEGQVWIVFNGEIYNYKKIKKDLTKKGYKFNSGSDTEVIINAYLEYGHDCLSYFNGMFAFAIWDSNKKELFIARDRLGIKPLYYFEENGRFIFSSEIKAILKHDVKREIDLNSLNSFFKYRFIANHKTMIYGIKKLLPGHFAVLKNKKLTIKKFWDVKWNIENKSEDYYVKKLDKTLFSSVKRRLMSDVPLGAFLSGGLDSSLIVAMNAKLKKEAVKTFTVGFGHETDEFNYAKKVSEHLSTDHHEINLDFKTITKKLPTIVWHMDEPNSDITMVPLYFLSEFAKKKVTVVNTGEGADEIFSGYEHFKVGAEMFKVVPKFVKGNVYSYYYSPFKKNERQSLFQNPITNEKNMLRRYLFYKKQGYPKDFLNRILLFDIKNELPNWQLTRVDRMTMVHGMEARVPFLDHEMVELSARMPVKYKQPNLNGKYILKKVAQKYLPRNIVHRKKQGFTTPMHAWMKNNLEDATQSFLFSNKKKFYNYDYITKLLNKHKMTDKPRPFVRYSYQLMMLLFFDIWYEMYINQVSENKIKNMLKI